MKVWEVYIDGGYVGDIRAFDVQGARDNAIQHYNIQHDQHVTLKPAKDN